MLFLNENQTDKLEKAYDERRQKRLWEEFKFIYPKIGKEVLNDDGLKIAHDAMLEADELEIFEDEDMFLFMRLAFLPKKILEDPWFNEMCVRILRREQYASERLEFIYKHILHDIDMQKYSKEG